MPYLLPTSHAKPFWKRIAAFLSFLAVLSALMAPSSMLAEALRTGKLGGLCSLNKPAGRALSAAAGQAGSDAPSGSHCDLCGSLGLALPAFAVQTLLSVPGMQLASAFLTFDLNAAIAGLPPGRGPPIL